jgi:DNA-directed RNA polymerase specialized sigma24 family protein
LPESAASYEDVVRFSFGVARNIAKERGREPASMEMPAGVAARDPDPEEKTSASQLSDAIRECLQSLGAAQAELIEDWHLDERKAHAEIAKRLDLTANALRLRVFHIKNRLEECLRKRGVLRTMK